MKTPLPTHSDVEEPFLRRILFIGNKVPETLANDGHDKFILSGVPADLIDELEALTSKSNKLLLERLLEQIPEKNDGYDFAKLPNHLKPYYNGFNEATDKITEAIKQMMESME